MVTQRAKQSTLTKRALKPGLETENRVRLFVFFILFDLTFIMANSAKLAQ